MGAGHGDEQRGNSNCSDTNLRFDSELARVWQRFEGNLTAHLADMPKGAYITITAAQATPGQRGQRPYIDLVAVESERIVGVASLASYIYPGSPEHLDLDLHLLGWTEPGKPAADGTVMDYVLDQHRVDASFMAAAAVATFVQLWNVPHPSFLSAWSVGPNSDESGPAQLNNDTTDAVHASAVELPSVDALPIALRSLHTFCELLGARVDPDTVVSVCGSEDIDGLADDAHRHARECARYGAYLRNRNSESTARVWELQARSWFDTALSLAAAERRLSGPDRPAKSAGS
ncbi:hypothetical protein QMK17_22450 [Rhodococcus sp. G-MC3]|uniref:TY-Chap domain-containing protein n=1 Tax=Rhodococcus sp. G-MC3 TaxID=3046209 RepID=UPI0024BAB081|nr:hypothetical protein [Rhodococcus sp. G-MC3]MDJ0396088.1 hypothetical protein [Rhodococcus sp. G-MC3]